MFFDFRLLLFIAPAILLGLWAQYRISSTYKLARQIRARVSGAQAAQMVLDSAGIGHVGIEMVPGHLSDHYDPQAKVLRLSPEVYGENTLAAVGIAAHEAGHAIQDAVHYAPLKIRNAAVPAANFGGGFGMLLAGLGVALTAPGLMLAGIVLFSGVVFFQLVNLPVEFNASTRAKDQLAQLGIVSQEEMPYVRKVLGAAALTYVAGTLQSVLTLLYYVLHFSGQQSRE